jgi:hypothetical protein
MSGFVTEEFKHNKINCLQELKLLLSHTVDISASMWKLNENHYVDQAIPKFLNHCAPIAYDVKKIKKNTINGFDYLLLNDSFIEKDYASLKRFHYKFNYNEIERKQTISNNIYDNYNYHVLCNPWPRYENQFLIIPVEPREQKLINDDKYIIKSILDDNSCEKMLFFNYHKNVVNHLHLHLILRNYSFENYIIKDNTRYTNHFFKNVFIKHKDFNSLWDQTLNYINLHNNESFSIHFKGDIDGYEAIFFYKPDMIYDWLDIHAHGVITIKSYNIFKNIRLVYNILLQNNYAPHNCRLVIDKSLSNDILFSANLTKNKDS